MPPPDGTLMNIRMYGLFLETSIIGLYFAADNIDYGGLRTTILLLQQ